MQPMVLTLPDSIRDRLEAALDFDAPPTDALVSPYDKVLREVLLDEHPAPEDRDFLHQFRESLLEFYTGSAPPAIQLRNLPRRGETGHHFVLGLNDLLGDGKRYEQTLHTSGAQRMHKDWKYQPDHPCKRLAMIYCADAGYPPVPTVMMTADEVIDHWAETVSRRGKYSQIADPAEALALAKQELIARLRDATCRIPREDGSAQELPLLMDNPGYRPDTGAPRFLFSINPRQIRQYIPNGHGTLLDREMETATNGLRNRLSETSQVSVEDNTVTVYNDPLLLHGRGTARSVPPEEAGRHAPRKVHAYDMFSSVALAEGEEFTPQVNAAGSPISYVSYVEHDGGMAIATRQR